MMTDRELLELAAKAAGIEVIRWQDDGSAVYRNDNGALISWHPLAPWGDGDALRLAVKLEMRLDVGGKFSAAYPSKYDVALEHSDNDPYARTRLAIVRAAAQIGKEKQ